MLLSLLLLVAAPVSQATTSAVPPAVAHTFDAKYPAATAVKWRLAADRNYEADFKWHGVHTIARYAAAGQLVETRSVIATFELPDPVQKSLLKQLSGSHIDETWRVEVPGAADQFLIESKNIAGAHVTRFSADGKVTHRS